ncbi:MULTISPECIES: DUF1656 domain-containing protein [Pseudomonas]|uniref:DUF1656 domain-containing protein n=1 Tax=Pseudomonas monteilii TaxID=76759 RepID=A0AAE6RDJ6_9PSED|nr:MULTISPECIES: DUF1656 domain-containing protein [Pseudomonas]MDH4549876.1 DUF1656 domain-containing protein [Pseudomonas sp. BN607]MDH4846074.1 DUF1656 domain-containing protein [Pseudomonas sp. BN605]MDH4858746.1 DUF1656 domain-containing protein [Pseudomonas sp. BN505]NWL08025.1 DUF1656 domain-containing protein [Pseudomonas hunanensis]QHB28787.1 DUF1656 domain-containing protein [Pseudomonas monteilii]
MTGELNVAGVLFSPLMLCLMIAFLGRLLLSRLLAALDLYRYIWRRTLFDLSVFFVLVGLAFVVLVATPHWLHG